MLGVVGGLEVDVAMWCVCFFFGEGGGEGIFVRRFGGFEDFFGDV